MATYLVNGYRITNIVSVAQSDKKAGWTNVNFEIEKGPNGDNNVSAVLPATSMIPIVGDYWVNPQAGGYLMGRQLFEDSHQKVVINLEAQSQIQQQQQQEGTFHDVGSVAFPIGEEQKTQSNRELAHSNR